MSKVDKRPAGGSAKGAPPKRGPPPKGGPKRPSSSDGGKGERKGAGGAGPMKSGGGGGGGGGKSFGGGGGKPSSSSAAAPPPPLPQNRKERKALSEQRKLATKKNYGTIAETVRLWESARPRAQDAQQRQKLAEDVARRFSGKAPELATHHSASRVLQWALRELPPGSKARAALVAEVRGAAVALARSKYGKHVVQRLVAHAQRGGPEGKAELDALVRAFRGHVVELLRHPHGADVLVDLYDAATPAQRGSMASEAYGREFVLLEGGASGGAPLQSVRALLATSDASKRRAVVASLQRALEPVLEKGLLHPPLTHRLLREYLEAAPGSLVAEAVDTLAATGGNALKMVHTADGAAVCCAAFAYGSARDRKRLVKGMKGYVAQTAANEHAHAVVSTALAVTDDTALTGKVIVGELKAHLPELVADKHGSRALLSLLADPSALPRYLPSSALAMMRPPPRTQRVAAAAKGGGESDEEADEEDGAAAAAAAAAGQKQKKQKKQKQAEGEEDGEEGGEEGGGGAKDEPEEAMVERPLGESKKDPEARRRELLAAGGFGAALVALVAKAAPGLLRAPGGGDVVVEVARGACGGLLWKTQREGVEAVHAMIVAAAAQQEPEEGAEQAEADAEPAGKGKKQRREKQDMAAAAAEEEDGGEEEEEAAAAAAEAATCGDPGCGHDHHHHHDHGEGEEEDEEEDGTPLLLSHYYASRALRRLALASREEGDGGDGARAFVAALWDGALRGRCADLAPTHAAKVLAAVATGGDARVRGEAEAELASVVDGGDVGAWAARFVGAKEAAANGGGGVGGGGKGAASGGKGKGKGKAAGAAKQGGGGAAKAPAAARGKAATAAAAQPAAAAAGKKRGAAAPN